MRPSAPSRALRPVLQLHRTLTPEGRLLFGLTLLAGATGLDVADNQIYLMWSVLAGLVMGSLALAPLSRLRGVSLTARVPRRVSVAEEVEIALRLESRAAAPIQAVWMQPPSLPGAKWIGRAPVVDALAPGGRAGAVLRVRFSARGEHRMEPVRARALVPLGLALGPSVDSEPLRILVVPRIAPVRRLRLPMGQRYQPGGVALASKTGESMELHGVRPYRPGDRVRDLHARSWARTGVPVIREFQQEYFSRVGVVLDTDGTAADAATLEAAISLCAGVTAHLARGEALIDLLVIGDAVHPLTLGRSLGFLEQALDLLACVRPGPRLDAESLLGRLDPFLGRLSCLVLITLGWDRERAKVPPRARARGVGVRVLVVAAGGQRGPAAPADPEAARLDVATITGDQGISM